MSGFYKKKRKECWRIDLGAMEDLDILLSDVDSYMYCSVPRKSNTRAILYSTLSASPLRLESTGKLYSPWQSTRMCEAVVLVKLLIKWMVLTNTPLILVREGEILSDATDAPAAFALGGNFLRMLWSFPLFSGPPCLYVGW